MANEQQAAEQPDQAAAPSKPKLPQLWRMSLPEEPEGEKEGAPAETPVHLLDNLVLNPANSGGSRFLLLTVAIELNKAAVAEQFKARDSELRDLILTALGTKTVEQLTDISQRDAFKAQVIAAVEARFGKKTIKRLYFPQFVVQ